MLLLLVALGDMAEACLFELIQLLVHFDIRLHEVRHTDVLLQLLVQN